MSRASESFLNSLNVRRRYGDVSDMWLFRRLSDSSGFPKPLIIAGRKYWKMSELVDWENRQEDSNQAA
jgi:hypothetical protein